MMVLWVDLIIGSSAFNPMMNAAPRRHFVPKSLAGTTSTGDMFDLAEQVVELGVDYEMRNVKFTQFGGSGEKVLFVPGIEFRGVSVAAQLESLRKNGFEPWVCWVDGADRTPFGELSDAVGDFVEANNVSVLVGESFGGLLVADLAVRRQLETTFVLVNPATSFRRTFWTRAGELVATEGATYAPAVGAAVTFLASDSRMVEKSVEELSRLDVSSLGRAVRSAETLARLVPAPTLRFRVREWLDYGSRRVDAALFRARGRPHPRMLLLAGAEDRFLPSAAEVDRLGRVFPNATVKILKNGGHALMVDPERLDLGKALRETFFARDDPVLDFARPSPGKLASTRASLVTPLRRLVSPVFFSTTRDGGVVRGLGGVPVPRDTGRPMLLVGNHQLLGLDLAFLIDEFLRDRDVLPRGLAHPAATGALGDSRRRAATPTWWLAGGDAPRVEFDDAFFTTFGAVEVTPKNFFKLMKANETVLLFPGGVRESNHGKREAHELFWPKTTDFVRVAAAFDADVVPFGAVGVADSFQILRDKDEPLFSSSGPLPVPSARRWAGQEEDFRFPLVVPSPRGPARVYFYFGKPMSTLGLNPKDRPACAAFYARVKATVQSNIDTLLAARRKDRHHQPRLIIIIIIIIIGSFRFRRR
ncbi:hypothetical protein CTAYLR_008250 [Chrysophaeum taylorii]|uniref:Uncharacterized protein n=1 Tax=Chrysophaeum taylorii TaxID=2483200 RepID=A0AAD7XP53_9STRA|nr:hypothetical protein CTAYLR_008250 [Chrysophaeum taylorii]